MTEIDLKTLGQSLNEEGKKMKEPTQVPNMMEQESKTMDTRTDSRWIPDIKQ